MRTAAAARVRAAAALRLGQRSDRGSGPVTALLVLAVLALFFALGFSALLSVGATQRSGAQHAADAAALGGAQGVLKTLSEALLPGFRRPADIADLVGGGSCLQVGRVDAARLASENTATLTAYCYNVFTDRVSVTVAGPLDSSTHAASAAKAEASTTFDASDCSLDPAFDLPTPAPSDDSDDKDPPPPPPAPAATWVDCGTGHLGVRFDLASARFHFMNLTHLTDGLEPRLTA
jgi:hypothetical protein